jgi:hypothetical protein
MLENRRVRFMLATVAITVGVYYVYEFRGSVVDVILASTSILIGIILLGTTLKKL